MLRPTGPRPQSNPRPSKFEAALRHNEPWPAAKSVTIQSGSETQAALITDSPKVPDADPDREVIWKVGVSAVRFDLSALLAKPVVARGVELNSKNAVVHSMGTTLCMLARSTESRFLFSADRAGTYSVAITVSSIDLEPWARRSDASKIPAAKLPVTPVRTPVATLALAPGAATMLAAGPVVPRMFTGLAAGYSSNSNGHLDLPEYNFPGPVGVVVVAKSSTGDVKGVLAIPFNVPESLHELQFSDARMLRCRTDRVRGSVRVYFGDGWKRRVVSVRGGESQIPADTTLEVYEWM